MICYCDPLMPAFLTQTADQLGLADLNVIIANFTGVSDPYEPPVSADVVIRSDRETIEESRDRILSVLSARGLLSPTAAEVAV